MRVKRLVNAKVEATFPNVQRRYGWGKYTRTDEQTENGYAEDLKDAVKEFHDFLRDHRSQDMVTLDVIMIHEDFCSFCGCKWEDALDEDGKPLCCREAMNEVVNTYSESKGAA